MDMKKYEIWLGSYSLGQGYPDPTEPQKIAEIEALDFRIACLKWELQSKLDFIKECETTGRYLDHQTCRWWYDFDNNRHSWFGKYYETKEEALKSF